mmetsp:Transcript_98625/g.283477  ORF Transcript_98625/g.283477 Transcript_98625/m.283477 type:complete len:275 (-) Transcript_98625:292-1116(-)
MKVRRLREALAHVQPLLHHDQQHEELNAEGGTAEGDPTHHQLPVAAGALLHLWHDDARDVVGGQLPIHGDVTVIPFLGEAGLLVLLPPHHKAQPQQQPRSKDILAQRDGADGGPLLNCLLLHLDPHGREHAPHVELMPQLPDLHRRQLALRFDARKLVLRARALLQVVDFLLLLPLPLVVFAGTVQLTLDHHALRLHLMQIALQGPVPVAHAAQTAIQGLSHARELAHHRLRFVREQAHALLHHAAELSGHGLLLSSGLSHLVHQLTVLCVQGF